VQLGIYAFHEFSEAGALPLLDNAYWHDATEELAEGAIGQWLSYSLLLVPVAFLLFNALQRALMRTRASTASTRDPLRSARSE
jgi:high-affinity iron transporter